MPKLSVRIATPDRIDPLMDVLTPLMSHRHLFCFKGDLGAGKTTLIKGICQRLGVKDDMSSPSFAIVNEYHSDQSGPVYHFDLYRLKSPSDLAEVGWFDYLAQGQFMFVEWPEMAEGMVPEDAVMIDIEPEQSSETRVLHISYDL
jgi:tRNA threonylcarbamoyladenosine biosynthesis protein TsaE